MVHMADQAELWGPTKNMTMFGLEDFFGYVMKQIKTRSQPVQSIMKADRGTHSLAMAKELLVLYKLRARAQGACRNSMRY